MMGRHVTDVTNASRTMLMDIASLQWSQELQDFFQLPSGIHLPKIQVRFSTSPRYMCTVQMEPFICLIILFQASSSNFGSLASSPLKGLDILGVVGDQQVASWSCFCPFHPYLLSINLTNCLGRFVTKNPCQCDTQAYIHIPLHP